MGIFDWASFEMKAEPQILYVRHGSQEFMCPPHSRTGSLNNHCILFCLFQVPSMDMVQFLPRCLELTPKLYGFSDLYPVPFVV